MVLAGVASLVWPIFSLVLVFVVAGFAYFSQCADSAWDILVATKTLATSGIGMLIIFGAIVATFAGSLVALRPLARTVYGIARATRIVRS